MPIIFITVVGTASAQSDFRKMGGTMSKGEVLNLWGVEAKLPDFEYDAKFTVTHFDFVLLKKSGELLSADNSGAFFSDKIKKWLRQTQPGDILFFENIKAVGPDRLERHLGRIVEKVY